MKNQIIIAVLFFLSGYCVLPLNAQINLENNSAQVVSYWYNQEKQEYQVTFNKYEVNGTDTLEELSLKYDVAVSVLDSSATAYTLEWAYSNLIISANDSLTKKIGAYMNNMKVRFKTDEYGTFQEVLNWEEIRDQMESYTASLTEELSDMPHAPILIEQAKASFQSKASIESNAIKDIVQYHNFHGVEYSLDQPYTGEIQLMNNFGGEPFKTGIVFWLDDLYPDQGYGMYKMQQKVNSKQLTDATYEYLKKSGVLGEELGTRDEFEDLTNNVWTSSIIDGASGWVISSLETRKITSTGITKIEERLMELK